MKKRSILALLVSLLSRRHSARAFVAPPRHQLRYNTCNNRPFTSRLYQKQIPPSSDDSSSSNNEKKPQSDKGAPFSDSGAAKRNDSLEPSSTASTDSVPSYKSIILFVSTTILIWLSEPLLSLVDTTLVGRQLSHQASLTQLAALGPATMLIDSLVYLTYFLSIATTSKLATSCAQSNYWDMQVTSSQILGVAGVLGGIITATVWACGTPLLTWCAGDAGTPFLISAALSYTKIRCSVCILAIMGMVAQSVCLAVRDTRTPMIAVVVAFCTNIIGDLLLIPRFGVQGAAIATAVASVASAVVLLTSIHRKMKMWNRKATTVSNTGTVNGVNGSMVNGNGALTTSTIVVDGKPILSSNNTTSRTDAKPTMESIRNGIFTVSSFSSSMPASTANNNNKVPPFISLPDRRSFLELMKLAGPIFFVLMGKVLCYSSLTLKATSFGVLSVATHNIMMRIFFFHATFGDSLTQAAQTYLPSALLLSRDNNTKVLLKKLYILATGIGVLSFVSIKAVLNTGHLFTTNGDIVTSMAKHTTSISIAALLHSYIMVLEGAIIATGDLKYLVATYTCTMGILFAQLKYATPHFAGVWFALLLFQMLRLFQFKSRVLHKVLLQRPSSSKQGEKGVVVSG